MPHPTPDRKLDIFLYDGASEGGAAKFVQSSNAVVDNGRPEKEEPADWKRLGYAGRPRVRTRKGQVKRARDIISG